MALRRQGRAVSAIRQAVESAIFLRRRPKRGSLKWALLLCFVWFIFRQWLWPSWSSSSDVTTPSSSSHQLLLKDKQGNVVSRKGVALSHFLGSTELSLTTTSAVNVSRSEATCGREPFLAILKDAGVVNASIPEILALPKWDQVTDLYGSKPVILGLETCQEFQRRVPVPDRYIGVAGNFNSGTTAFGISLQANCRYPKRRSGETNRSNHVMTDVNGMLSQVPWAKHKFAQNRTDYTIQPEIPVDHVLPVILVRDPYFWMISMCKQGYGVRWDHNPQRHCPNLVPNDYDRTRFKRLRNRTSVIVWMDKNPKVGPSWPSLAHFWNDWHESYLRVDYPHLLIRFEDTLYHPKEVLRQVCQCGGAQLVDHHQYNYLVDEAKWNHKHSQNNMISAMIKYGTDHRRYYNMTEDDLTFAQSSLSRDLMKAFHYKVV